VINIAGQIFLDNFSNPFRCLDEILKEVSDQTEHIILDFHAEATSEKVAMGWYADGRVSAVIGTHTHIQTADDRILHQGTAYITDVGMTGPYDSVIGTNKKEVLYRFTTMLPVRYKVAQEEVALCGVALDLDDQSGNAKSIERIQVPL
jgi:metallophosphoesterase (TIGR00282 family)